MSPILVRPVREQIEHDRIIRLLHLKARRRYEAGVNPGSEQNVPVGSGPTAIYPDLVLQSQDRGHRLQAVVEVETGESVNHLEALAEWAHFGKLRAAFHLYVPAAMIDVARRLCEDNQVRVNEVWSYHTVGDQVRFTLVDRIREAPSTPTRVRAQATRPARPRPRNAAKQRMGKARPASRPGKASKKTARARKRK